MLWSLASQLEREAPLLQALAAAALRQLQSDEPAFKPHDLAATAWSLANLRLKHWPLLNAIADQAVIQHSAFGPRQIANMLWACAKIRFSHVPLWKALAAAALQQLDQQS